MAESHTGELVCWSCPCLASLIGVVLVFFACLAYWTALLCRSLNRFSDNRKAAAMTAEFSLALDVASTPLVCA